MCLQFNGVHARINICVEDAEEALIMTKFGLPICISTQGLFNPVGLFSSECKHVADG